EEMDMRLKRCIIMICACIVTTVAPAVAQRGGGSPAASGPTGDDPITVMVSRLELEKYKATIKGLTQFGDRRQGTERNRRAIDWIEAQLKSYGCTNTERIKYEYNPPPPAAPSGGARGANPNPAPPRDGRYRRIRMPDSVNNDPNKQPDARIRELNMEQSTPGPREEVFCTKIGTTHPEEMYIVNEHMDGIGWSKAANDDRSGT